MVKQAVQKTKQMVARSIPIILGVLLLVNLINPVMESIYPRLFTGNWLLDPLAGAIAGSISFGIPIVSYVIGGSLRTSGVSLLAVTAFILTWSTVGLVMLPLEMATLGKRFAIMRNSLNVVLAILVSILTMVTMKIW